MDSRVLTFIEGLKNKRVAFIGIGVSHREMIAQFVGYGAIVTLCDRRSRENVEEADELEALGVTLKLGDDYLDGIEADMIIRTPGMYFGNEKLTCYRKNGVAVTSEMELFFDLCPCRTVAVTGSDGKTTTTTVIAKMLEADGNRVHLGGNIGRALMPIIEEIKPDDYAVVELSSFQLMGMRRSPDIAVITNVAPNHLDVHGTMDEYIDSKKNLLLHQGAFSRAVLNADNEITLSLCDTVRGETRTFSRKGAPERGAYMTAEGDICYRQNGGDVKIMHRSDIKLIGDHNAENYLAAISALYGTVSEASMVKVAREFGGVKHRFEFIREKDGVKWYNDSIATSPTRTIAGLNAINQKVILIAGGYDKKIPFLPLGPKIIEKVKHLILLGATAEKIRDTVISTTGYRDSGLTITMVSSLEEAARAADSLAVAGDIVTLSPACASFDTHKNFEQRGDHFKEIVNAL